MRDLETIIEDNKDPERVYKRLLCLLRTAELRPKVALTSKEWQKRWGFRAAERAAANSRWEY